MTDRPDPDMLHQEAIGWVVRVNDPAFADWDAFEAWLGASPVHAEAYHAVALAEADLVEVLRSAPHPAKEPQPAPQRSARGRRWVPWAGVAVAASLIGVIVWQVQPSGTSQVYETAAGAQRTIALADGSSVILNGSSRLTIDAGDSRSLTLAHGEALFTVRHDASRPFRVTVGEAQVVDVGTRFDVLRESGATRVAVAEGAVDWRGQANSPVRVNAGHQLRARDGADEIELSTTTPETVGGWSQGQLDYDGTALGEVAADLSLSLGVAVVADPAVAHRLVRGVVRLDGGADAVVPRLAAIAGVHARHEGGRWRLRASP